MGQNGEDARLKASEPQLYRMFGNHRNTATDPEYPEKRLTHPRELDGELNELEQDSPVENL